MQIGVAAVGDVTDVSAFSGTPFHFLKALQEKHPNTYGWKMDLERLNSQRYLWNIGRILSFQKKGGFQYSEYFTQLVNKQIPQKNFSDTIISFNQHYPYSADVTSKGGTLYHYIDGTFTQLIERYGIGEIIGRRIKAKTLELERQSFHDAKHIVTFQQWAKESVVNDYGIDSSKVSVILPGANIIPPDFYKPSNKFVPNLGVDETFVIGFVGKDWKRKGLPIIIESAQILHNAGFKVKIKCAGNAPKDLSEHPLVEFAGFIDKSKEPEKFLSFLESCHLGCLFSDAEFSSISVFEFLRAGVPVSGYIVDGMGDLYFPDASIRFKPRENAQSISDGFLKFLQDENYRKSLCISAQEKSSYVTWERSVEEWEPILK